MASLLDLLARNPLFATLDPADRLALAQEAVGRCYQEGEPVVTCGDVWPYLLLVAEGSLVALAGERPLTTLEAGDLFWGQALFREGAPMLVDIVPRDESYLYLWPQERLLPVFARNPAALWSLCRLVAARLEWMGGVLDGFAYQPVAGRLARLLLSRSARTGDGRVPGDLTIAEMASWARTSPPVVCRMLYRFTDQGLIHFTRAGLVLLDREGLDRLAEAG